MGADGGSIPQRSEMVKTASKKATADPAVLSVLAWFYCPVSKTKLQQPIVGDCMGRLYNKQSILEYLLDPSTHGDADKVLDGLITSLNDTYPLTLTPNPAFDSRLDSDATEHTIASKPPFICPITRKEMNGTARFSFLATCGCVLSEEALTEIPSPTCLVCSVPFRPEHAIPIHSNRPADVEAGKFRLKVKIEQRQADALARKERKREKRAKKLVVDSSLKESDQKSAEDALSFEIATDREGALPKSKRVKHQNGKDTIHTPATASSSSNINMPLPNLGDSELLKRHSNSKAIQSLYAKKGEKKQEEGNFLVRGTFNRFAATF